MRAVRARHHVARCSGCTRSAGVASRVSLTCVHGSVARRQQRTGCPLFGPRAGACPRVERQQRQHLVSQVPSWSGTAAVELPRRAGADGPAPSAPCTHVKTWDSGNRPRTIRPTDTISSTTACRSQRRQRSRAPQQPCRCPRARRASLAVDDLVSFYCTPSRKW